MTTPLRGPRPRRTAETRPGAPSGSPPADDRTWTIAQIADDYGITHRTLRHYEDLGLLSPERRGTQRIYRKRERTRLSLILRGRRLGFPLDEVATILDLYAADRGQAHQLAYVLQQIDDRRADLERRRRDVDAALTELDEFEALCRHDLAQVRSQN